MSDLDKDNAQPRVKILTAEPPPVTLRDQFAMAALTGLLQKESIYSASLAAEVAYHMADAMLKQREAK